MATPDPVTLEAVTAETVCESGSLSANGLTQAQLDYEFLGAVLENDLEGACEYLRRGANIEIREDEVGRPYNLSALMIAAGRGGYNYPDMTRLLLANGAKTDARDGSGWVTALHIAAVSDHTETAALILDWGGDVNVLSSAGDPPLYQAAHWGRADMVRLLLSRGADPDIQADTGVAPLHGAASNVARSGSAAVVSLLLSHGAKPNLRRSHSNPGFITRAGETGYSPLDDLVVRGYGGYAEAARILREAGGKCFVRTSPLCGEVHVAVDFSSSGSGTVSAEGGGDALSDGGEVRQGATVMFTATPAAGHYVSGWSGNCAEVGEIADGLDGTAKFCATAADSDLSVRAEFSEIPSLAGPLCPSGSLSANGLTQAQLDAGLISAAEGNDLAGACEYLRRGANVDARESGRYYKRTALMIATTDGRLELAKLLYANGADVNLAGGNHDGYDVGRGWTALQYSGAAGRPELAGWLLDSGAELNSEWVTGKTALWEAAYWGRPDVVKLLLSRGAETNGGGALLHAAVLLDEGGWVSARRYWANGPAFRYKRNAISYSYPIPTADEHGQVVSLLLSHDAEVNARYQGRSPLDYAARQGDERLSAMLRDAGGICYVETGPLCGVAEVVTAETVCESGSLSANGLTQAQLDAGLISAAEDDDLESACEYLRRGANVDARESGRYYKRTALMIAANDGFLDLAKLLHTNGANVNLHGGTHDGNVYGRGLTALHYAGAAGRSELARWLLDAGAELNAEWVTGQGKTALWEAAYWGRPDVVNVLLSRGAETETYYNGGATPLHAAVLLDEWVSARVYWANGPAFRYKRNAISYSYPIPTADEHGQVVSLLLSHDAEVNARYQGRSPLDYAARQGDERLSAMLRDAGGICYVETGALCGVAEVVTAETVCESGSLSANGLTQAQLDAGLLSAAKANDLAKVCEHLRRGADMNARDRLLAPDGLHRRTPLMLAAVDNRLELAKLLVGNGASVNYQSGGPDLERQDGAGWSALMYAAGAGQVETATYLLDQGAEINMQWASGYSSLHEAAIWGRYETVELLIARGANVNVRDYGVGETPLHGASWGGNRGHFTSTRPSSRVSWEKVIKALLDGGADVNARVDLDNPSGSRAGRSPLDTVALHYMSRRAAKLRDAGGYCYVQTSSLCAYPPVAEADSLECPAGTLPTNGLTAAELNMTLRMAARGGDATRVCEALRRGAEVNDNLDDSEFTPLQEAVSGGHLEAVKVLLANGADVNKRKGGAGHSPLDLAARDDQAEIAALLRNADGRCFLETGPLCQNVPVATPDPVTVVNTVAATVANTVVATVANTVVAAVENTVASTVATGSCPAGTLDANGLTQAQLDQAMLDAVSDGDVEEVCEYLRRGANVGAYSETEYPGLALVQPNDVDMAKLLLENGADPNQRKSILHAPPLWFEAKGVEIIRLYLSYGADPNLGSDPRQSSKPLHHAAYYNNWRVMEALLEFGAEPNVRDTKPGWRMSMPLHFVFDGTRTNSDLAVSVLLSGGADVNALDGGGNSALDLAVRDNNAAAAQVLRDAGGQCFVRTGSLCGSAPVPAAAAESAPATDRLRESFAGAFNPSPAFGDAFGAASGSSERFLSRLDSLMRSTSGSGGNAWDSFAGWQRENEHGRMWFSTGQRGDFGFGAGVGGAGGDLSASPFAAMVGNGMLAGGETGLGAAGKLRIAAFADYQARSLLDGTDRQWTKWAASGTAIETAMTEAERFAGLAENQTRGAMTEIHLGGGDLGVALQAGAVSESDAMLSGTAGDENLRGLRARTAFAGLSGAADLFGSGWRLRGSAHLGRSWAESESMLQDGDLWASAFSAGLERGGWLYSDDGFILRFSQPLRVESLEMELIGEGGASRLGADPSGRQLDVDAAYRLPLSGGGWLLLSAGVRRDGGHTSSSDLEAGALFSVERGF